MVVSESWLFRTFVTTMPVRNFVVFCFILLCFYLYLNILLLFLIEYLTGEYVCQSGKYRVTLYLNINEEGPSGQLFKASQSSLVTAGNDSAELFFREDISRSSSQAPTSPSKRALTYVKDVYVHEGVRFVELKCQVRSPDTQVEWVRNNRPIDKSSTKYEMISRGCDRILIIRNPNKADNGDYTCQTESSKVITYFG